MPDLEHALALFSPHAPGPADQEFLSQLYASTRQDLRGNCANLDLLASLMGMHQRMQASAYQLAYPNARTHVLYRHGERFARIVTEISEHGLRLVDIALLAQARGQGLGTLLLRALQDHAASQALPVSLAVHHSNPNALRLYKALGFVTTGSDKHAVQMIWRP